MSLTSAPSKRAEVYVLDSWPFVERALRGVPIQHLDALTHLAAQAEVQLLISEMNIGEIYYLVAKQKGDARAETEVLAITQLPLRVMPVAPGDVLKAARLKAQHTLSYADCFCAGLAITYGATVVTGDPDFLLLEQKGLIRVQWVGA